MFANVTVGDVAVQDMTVQDMTVHPGSLLAGVPSSSLRQRKKDATHQTIAEAAWELFEEQGYAETSINDIADRANIAPRTFFRYFPSKEAVVYPEFDAILVAVRAAFFARPSSEPVMGSLLAALDTLSHRMSEEDSRNQARLHILKSDKSQGFGEYFRRRITDEVSMMVLERDAGLPDVELRARLASGIFGVIIDTSQEHLKNTGAAEPFPDVGHRCMSIVQQLLTVNVD